MSEVVYRPGSKERLGVRISIPPRPSTAIFSKTPLEEIRDAVKEVIFTMRFKNLIRRGAKPRDHKNLIVEHPPFLFLL